MLHSVKEAAQMLSVGRTTVFLLIKQNKLEVVKIGRRTLIKTDSLKRLAASGSGGKTA